MFWRRLPRDNRTSGPIFSQGHLGLAVERKTMERAIEQQLRTGNREPLVLMVSAVQPAKTPASYGSIVVVNRGANTLKLYHGIKPWRTFRVATGQWAYPTPRGRWDIVVKWKNPWWYPPNSAWAAGSSPIPPGPGPSV